MSEKSLKIPFNGNEFFINIADGNMVNLNHIFEISGASGGKDPRRWKSLESTKTLIKSMNVGESDILKTKRGEGGGTWGHWQLALSYAQYLSPELHIVVNSVFKERLEETIDPELGINRSKERARKAWKAQGKSDKWIAEREQGKYVHGIYVDTLINHEVKPGYEIGQCTNQIYQGLFHTDKAGLEKSIRDKNPDLPKRINVRDHAKLSSIAAISLSEALSSEKIEDFNASGVIECSNISLEKATSVRLALNDSASKDKASLPPIEKKVVRNPAIYRKKFKEMKDALK